MDFQPEFRIIPDNKGLHQILQIHITYYIIIMSQYLQVKLLVIFSNIKQQSACH